MPNHQATLLLNSLKAVVLSLGNPTGAGTTATQNPSFNNPTATMETQPQQLLQPPQPTSFPRRKKQSRSMVYGYLVQTDFLEAYCDKHGIPKSITMNNEFNAMVHILEAADLYWRGNVCGARGVNQTSGHSQLCIAIADNSCAERMKIPPLENIKKMQEALETTEPPRWHFKA